MRASFTRAIHYWITAKCISPLRSGHARVVRNQMLTTHTGHAMIQAASIAGAMNAWRRDTELFGEQERESGLCITDAIFKADTVIAKRSRVQVNAATSAMAGGGKYTVLYLPAGSVCEFELIWRGNLDGDFRNDEIGDKQIREITRKIESYLAGIQNGEILFGGRKSSGFGHMELLTVKRRIYNMFDPEDRAAWLADTDDGTEIKLAAQPLSDVLFTVEAATNMVLVKSSEPLRDGDERLRAVQTEENGEPIIPGSSLKGAVFAHMRKIAPFLGIGPKELDRIMGRGAKEDMDKENAQDNSQENGQDNNQENAQDDIRENGQDNGLDNGVVGKVHFSDASLSSKQMLPYVARLRINKLTGGVVKGALYRERPVGGVWHWRIHIPMQETAGCLLTLYALRDLGLGLYQLGGGKAIGRGTVSRININIQAGKKSASMLVEGGQVSIQDGNGLFQDWEEALTGGKQIEN